MEKTGRKEPLSELGSKHSCTAPSGALKLFSLGIILTEVSVPSSRARASLNPPGNASASLPVATGRLNHSVICQSGVKSEETHPSVKVQGGAQETNACCLKCVYH